MRIRTAARRFLTRPVRTFTERFRRQIVLDLFRFHPADAAAMLEMGNARGPLAGPIERRDRKLRASLRARNRPLGFRISEHARDFSHRGFGLRVNRHRLARRWQRTAQRRGPASHAMTSHQIVVQRGKAWKWCPGAGSNHRHCDFQSHALPTELPGHTRGAERPERAGGL